jgi:hypothetical protein
MNVNKYKIRKEMDGFKKKKTAENQLFDVFFENMFAGQESQQQSNLFILNLNKEVFFVNKLANFSGHLRSDLKHTSPFLRYKDTQIFSIGYKKHGKNSGVTASASVF